MGGAWETAALQMCASSLNLTNTISTVYDVYLRP